MRWAVLLLVACGCERVFGLDSSTDAGAAPTGDALDAPPAMCPAFGAGPPSFTGMPQTFAAAHCTSYTTSAVTGTAVAECDGELREGPIGGLPTGPLDIVVAPGTMLQKPRLAPEGDELMVIATTAGMMSSVQRYRRAPGTSFALVDTLPIGGADASAIYGGSVSTPSAGPDRRVVVHLFAGATSTLVELGLHDGAWGELSREERASVTAWAQPSLSPDGTRMVLFGTLAGNTGGTVLYRERMSLGVPFGPVVALPAPLAQNRQWPFLTGDCARLYMSGIDDLELIERD